MIDELLDHAEGKFPLVEVMKNKITSTTKSLTPSKSMVHPELSLGPSRSYLADTTQCFSSESEAKNRRKRKLSFLEQPNTQTSIDLQLNDPLPLDWEQCLDLHSGKMYYLNRKTQKKSWLKPKELKLDLDLNISYLPSSECQKAISLAPEKTNKKSSCGTGRGGMVAIVCLNCHLLVMLHQSSPSCPNCKYMHLLLPSPVPQKMQAVKSLETLSLLH